MVFARKRKYLIFVWLTLKFQISSMKNLLSVLVLLNHVGTHAIITCGTGNCISHAKLTETISTWLDSKVTGYTFIIGAETIVSRGLSQTAAEPGGEQRMSSDQLTNMASLSKTITAIAVLQLLKENQVTVDAPISPFLYPDWKLGPHLDQLTFRQLLTHRSGLGQLPGRSCELNVGYPSLRTILREGVRAEWVNQPQYGNCNFALVRELFLGLKKATLLPDGPERARQSLEMYVDYVNERVFRPVGIGRRSCQAPDPNVPSILSYISPNDVTMGNNWGDWSDGCGSEGWVLSAMDMSRILNSLSRDEKLLTIDQRIEMVRSCLGWDCALRDDCPDASACKNGHLYDGMQRNIWTFAGMVQCNVPVVNKNDEMQRD